MLRRRQRTRTPTRVRSRPSECGPRRRPWSGVLAAAVALMTAALVTACTGTSSPSVAGRPATGTAVTPSGSGPAGPLTSTGTSAGPSASPAPATESNPPGDIPDTQAFVPVTAAGAPVTLLVPEGWARTQSGQGTVFDDKLNRIQVTATSTAAAPTVASVTGTDLPALRGSVPNFTPGQVTADSRTVGPVIVTTYQGDSPVDPITGKVARDAFERYTYFKNGTRVDVTLSGPVNADNVDPWRKVTDSVRWTA